MTVYDDIAAASPTIARGQVWCTVCERMQRVDGAQCLRSGWPKCCGYTMTLDSPRERAAVAKAKDEGAG